MKFFIKIQPLTGVCAIAAAIALLALTAHTAPGKGGGKDRPAPATLEFDDIEGDAIQSDGLGDHDVSIEQDGLVTRISLGKKQELFFDFSDCDDSANLSCEGPFGPDTTSDYVAGVTFALVTSELDGAPNTSGRVGLSIGFRTPEGNWGLGRAVDVYRFDDDDDGVVDRYVFDNPGTNSDLLSKFFSRRGIGSGAHYLPHGRFFMPWGATLRIP
jgi:hypothetical protein